ANSHARATISRLVSTEEYPVHAEECPMNPAWLSVTSGSIVRSKYLYACRRHDGEGTTPVTLPRISAAHAVQPVNGLQIDRKGHRKETRRNRCSVPPDFHF
ncbi:hypothetical protein, partial [Protofrankia symbiont of Coriaria ruscifolia]|uniref:hypothetical protein n=1 Tax=Protofrankia symbiont of Coriaria ruscifolia TaxID=1306542 RepID=UPI001A942E8C